MAYGLSNGQVTDDVTWPWKVKLVTSLCLEHNVSKTAGFSDSVQKDHQSEMAYGLSNCNVTDDVTWPRSCYEAVRSAILATAWLLVFYWFVCVGGVCLYVLFTSRCTLVQSAVLRLHVVCLSVCPSVRLWRWWIVIT